tara:strand:- start:348 stop:947 length:600 start_codon:yes stop_codon:yes gene_type:complete
MSLATYAELKSSVANWLNRTDLTAEIPDFIKLAEIRIAHEVRLTVNEKTASVTSNAQGAIAIPADLLELIDVFYNDKPIDRVSLTYLRGLSPQSGTPACFAREGNQIVFFPTPTMQASDTLVINYFYRVPDLSESATTNDLFAKIPEMYLFGALSEAATFLDADSARWEQSYQAAFNRTVADDRAAEVAGSSAQVQSGY